MTHPATAWIKEALQAEIRGEWAIARRAWLRGWSTRLNLDDALAMYCWQQYQALVHAHLDPGSPSSFRPARPIWDRVPRLWHRWWWLDVWDELWRGC